MEVIKENGDVEYCKSCKCRFLRTLRDYNRFSEPLRTCLKCRIRNNKRKFKYSPSITAGLE